MHTDVRVLKVNGNYTSYLQDVCCLTSGGDFFFPCKEEIMDKRLVVCTLITAGRFLWSLLQWLLVDWGALKVWWQGFDYKITELLQATFLISNSDRISRTLCIRRHQMWNRDSSLRQQYNFNLQMWLPNFQSFFTQLKIILKTTDIKYKWHKEYHSLIKISKSILQLQLIFLSWRLFVCFFF